MNWLRRGPSPWLPQSRLLRDFDHDGIPDKFEEDLLRRFRPFYKFSTARRSLLAKIITLWILHDGPEEFRPVDAIWQVKHSQLRESDWIRTWPTPDLVKGCGKPPDFKLDPPEQILTCRGD